MKNYNPFDIPTVKDKGLSLKMYPKTLEKREKMAKVPYSSMVKSLIYIVMCTRPDIYYIVGLVNQY